MQQREGPATVLDRDALYPTEFRESSAHEVVGIGMVEQSSHIRIHTGSAMEIRYHTRHHHHRPDFLPNEGSLHPATGVVHVAVVRPVSLNAGKVLHVGRRRQKQQINIQALHFLAQLRQALRVVHRPPFR